MLARRLFYPPFFWRIGGLARLRRGLPAVSLAGLTPNSLSYSLLFKNLRTSRFNVLHCVKASQLDE
jgi:hypothetical protein